MRQTRAVRAALGEKLDAWLTRPVHFWSTISVLFVAARITTWLFPFDSDHWIFWYVGKNWLRDNGLLYVTAWDHKAPLIFAFNGAIDAVFGNSMVAARIIFTLISLLTLFLVYLAAKQLYALIQVPHHDTAAKVSALVYAVWSNLAWVANSGNNTENFGVAFLALALWSYLKWRASRETLWVFGSTRQNWRWLLLSGVAVSGLIGLKANFGLLVLPLGIDLVIRLWGQWRRLGINTLLFGLPSIAQLLWWWSYFSKDNLLPLLWDASFGFNSDYLRASWRGGVSDQAIFAVMLLPFVIFFAPAVVQTIRKKGLVLPRALAAASVIFAVSLGTFFGHYFLIITPLLALCFGLWYRRAALWQWAVLAVCAAAALLLSGRQVYHTFAGNAADEFRGMQAAANYVRDRTSTTQRLFYYGYGATFYRLSERNSGSRYISASHLLLDEREGFGYNLTSTWIGDMEIFKPVYVVISQEDAPLYAQNSRAVRYIERRYTKETTIQGFEIWRRNPAETTR